MGFWGSGLGPNEATDFLCDLGQVVSQGTQKQAGLKNKNNKKKNTKTTTTKKTLLKQSSHYMKLSICWHEWINKVNM